MKISTHNYLLPFTKDNFFEKLKTLQTLHANLQTCLKAYKNVKIPLEQRPKGIKVYY